MHLNSHSPLADSSAWNTPNTCRFLSRQRLRAVQIPTVRKLQGVLKKQNGHRPSEKGIYFAPTSTANPNGALPYLRNTYKYGFHPLRSVSNTCSHTHINELLTNSATTLTRLHRLTITSAIAVMQFTHRRRQTTAHLLTSCHPPPDICVVNPACHTSHIIFAR